MCVARARARAENEGGPWATRMRDSVNARLCSACSSRRSIFRESSPGSRVREPLSTPPPSPGLLLAHLSSLIRRPPARAPPAFMGPSAVATDLTAQLRAQLQAYLTHSAAISQTLRDANALQAELEAQTAGGKDVRGELERVYDRIDELTEAEFLCVVSPSPWRTPALNSRGRLVPHARTRQPARRCDGFARRDRRRAGPSTSRRRRSRCVPLPPVPLPSLTFLPLRSGPQ